VSCFVFGFGYPQFLLKFSKVYAIYKKFPHLIIPLRGEKEEGGGVIMRIVIALAGKGILRGKKKNNAATAQ